MKPAKLFLLILLLLVVFNIAGGAYLFYRNYFNKRILLLWPVKDIKTAEVEEKDGKLYFSLPVGTPLYTAFSGKSIIGGKVYTKLDPPQNTATLTFEADDGKKLEYEMVGGIIIRADTSIENSSDTVIARIGEEKIRAVGNYNLILSFMDRDGKKIDLEKKMFKNRK